LGRTFPLVHREAGRRPKLSTRFSAFKVILYERMSVEEPRLVHGPIGIILRVLLDAGQKLPP
jgi:hypothetical protein